MRVAVRVGFMNQQAQSVSGGDSGCRNVVIVLHDKANGDHMGKHIMGMSAREMTIGSTKVL